MRNLDNKHELALSWTKLEEGHTGPSLVLPSNRACLQVHHHLKSFHLKPLLLFGSAYV